MKIILQGKEKELEKPARIMEFIDNKDHKYMAARVNNRLRELRYIVSTDAKIDLLGLEDSDVCRIYQSTLRYLVFMALHNVYPNAKITYNYSVSRSIFASVSNFGRPFLQSDLDAVNEELKKIIEADYPIVRSSLTKEEAVKLYKELGSDEKVRILKYRKEDTVHVYECNGFMDYMFGYMLPSTGYVKKYLLKLYTPGFLISYPRSETNGEIPDFQDEKVFRNSLKEANRWSNTARASYIADFNEIVESGRALEYLNICEARHNKQLADLGQKIQNRIDDVKLICVAGPSSSGKTTFTNRLRIELMSRGITPLMISIDNFYKHPDQCPIGADGKPDFEDIDALDRALFNECMYKLIQGEKVALPTYDFTTKKRTFSEPVKLMHHQPILIEGIHALNDDLTPSINQEEKFKVYIAPLIQYRIDERNPISISDLRLIRRMVRDYNYRGTTCERTLEFWPSVRAGEFKWIYPYQNDADFVFNSELGYELCVLSKYAIKLLSDIKDDSPYYITANRLLKFLKYFTPISDKWVPCNSIIREFIGGSIFYTEDKI